MPPRLTPNDDPSTQASTQALGDGPDAPGSPWRTLGGRQVYRNPWLAVTEYDVVRPDGGHGIYGVVDPGDNVTMVALENDESVWLIREFSYPLQRDRWILPSGRVEPGEDPLQAAQRELAEEVGLHAATWKHLGAFPLSGGISTQVSHIFLAQNLQRGTATPEVTERIEPRLTPLRHAYSACLDGVISDASVVLAIWRVWTLLHDGAGVRTP
jgi:8-oxo-dGTP pyrophosphatase MutT (NUDIX family)